MSQHYRLGYIFVISLISALGGYLFGFDFAVISGALPFLKTTFGLTTFQEGFTTASLAIGCIAGCIAAGKLSEKKGRRYALQLAALIFTVSSLSMAVSASISWFIVSRFFAGTAVGMASVLSPMYIAEIAPAHLRGRMVSLNQFAIVIGILFTNVINYFLSASGEDSWRWMFGSGAIPSLLFLGGIFFLPESPLWLITAGRQQKAMAVLNKIGDASYAQRAMAQMLKTSASTQHQPFSVLFGKRFIKPVMAGAFLALFQQFCGINVVFNYTTTIFESIGLDKNDQLMQTVFTGSVNLVFTFVAIGLVDKVGRKPLMLAGAVALAVLYVVIAQALNAASPYSSVVLLAAIGVYASTIAPTTWVLISEIFPGEIREQATSFSVVCLWAAYFILTFTFPVLAEMLGDIGNTFYVYAVICGAGAVFIYYKVKETKGIALEDMGKIFRH